MTTNTLKTLRDALDALEAHQEYGSPTLLTGAKAVKAINDLRTLIAAMEQQQPYCWHFAPEGEPRCLAFSFIPPAPGADGWKPIYAALAQPVEPLIFRGSLFTATSDSRTMAMPAEVLHVSTDGVFTWCDDADAHIEECEGSLKYILRRLRGAKPADIKHVPADDTEGGLP